MTPSIKQTVLTDPLYAAIRLLTEEADSLRECHTRTPGDWAGEPEAKALYDHILAVVDALSKLRAPVADERQALEHVANEWADMATSAIQWMRNIKDGISTPDAALESLMSNLTHCREVQSCAGVRASAPVVGNNMRNPNLSQQGGWINTDGFCDFLILAGIIGAIVGGILVPEVISFLWDFAKPWIHEATK
ncbi:hypothetical protein A7J71_11170 [Achromobacter insolitus]|uniref:hypothetical protein n=1 Tax=Achromobacter insolitus TaxID=217204 RepID=UPI0007C7324D|nr:hypothetical protein [Achromobacter insolitus]OAE72572.1 hypothetical protein A7J71_11170 [Achromobacter insolitus]